MNNEKFNSLLEEFKRNSKLVSNSNNLEDLKEKYISLEITRENIHEYILSSTDDDETKSNYFNKFGQFENSLWSENHSGEVIAGIPIFDFDISFDEIDQMFDDYGSYFQRYGCLTSDQIVSWDKENVLFDDEFGNVEIVKRPDILLNIQ
jgi:hypothetical protein